MPSHGSGSRGSGQDLLSALLSKALRWEISVRAFREEDSYEEARPFTFQEVQVAKRVSYRKTSKYKLKLIKQRALASLGARPQPQPHQARALTLSGINLGRRQPLVLVVALAVTLVTSVALTTSLKLRAVVAERAVAAGASSIAAAVYASFMKT